MDLVLATPSGHSVRRRLGGLAGSMVLHLLAAALIAVLPAGIRGAAERVDEGPGTVSVFSVSPDALSGKPGDQILAEEPVPDETVPTTESGDVRIATAAFDVARVRSRLNWLFPFLTTGLLFLEGARDNVGTPDATLMNPFALLRRARSRPSLSITEAELQGIVDRAWSRRERWSRFAEIAKLVDTHDPNRGDVPDLVRAYLDQNLLQPYYDAAIRDARFWAMLDCVADHVEFIDWVRSFSRQHPSSRTTTELLFLLDEFAQGSRDTLLMLLSTEPERDLQYTRSVSRSAYDLAMLVRRQYGDWVRDHQLETPGRIRRRYDDLRLRLLSTIIETTPGGYRAADARFLAGEILFNQNNRPDALRMWRAIRPDPRDSYADTYSELLGEMQSPDGATASEINRILGAEHRRWLDFSAERLRHFGYAFDTF